jgi:hypothetical protein
MPKIANKKFVPVNKSEAKEHIFRSIKHDHETREYSKEKKVKQPSAVNSPSNFEKKLSDPFFASKLDKMSKISYSKMMYSNQNTKDKESLYDYQKIQSTA